VTLIVAGFNETISSDGFFVFVHRGHWDGEIKPRKNNEITLVSISLKQNKMPIRKPN
jgi:hypothetical protein